MMSSCTFEEVNKLDHLILSCWHAKTVCIFFLWKKKSKFPFSLQWSLTTHRVPVIILLAGSQQIWPGFNLSLLHHDSEVCMCLLSSVTDSLLIYNMQAQTTASCNSLYHRVCVVRVDSTDPNIGKQWNIQNSGH